MVSADRTAAITGRKADLVAATYVAHEICSRIIRPGRRAGDLTEAIERVAAIFGVSSVLNIYSSPIERFVFDTTEGQVASFADPQNPIPDADFAFEENTAYQVNVAMTLASSGKTKEVSVWRGKPASVYQRNAATIYNCRVKSSRQLLSEIERRFGAMPFTMR